MKRILLLITFLIAHFYGFSQAFVVDDLHVDVYVNPSGYFDVVENYDITFTQRSHGIIRTIRTKYKLEEALGDVRNHKIELSKVEVPDHPFEKPSKLNIKYNDELNIKIGDPNKLISGSQHYQIKYRVKNAFLFDGDKAQLYWNLKGSDWLADFKHISFKIHLADNPVLSREDFFVYSGETGSTVPNDNIQVDYANGVVEAYNKLGDIKVPIIVRLQGTNAEEAKVLIEQSGLKVYSAVLLQEAADLVTEVLATIEH